MMLFLQNKTKTMKITISVLEGAYKRLQGAYGLLVLAVMWILISWYLYYDIVMLQGNMTTGIYN